MTGHAAQLGICLRVTPAFRQGHGLKPNRGRVGFRYGYAAGAVALGTELRYPERRREPGPTDRRLGELEGHRGEVVARGAVTPFTPNAVVRGCRAGSAQG